MSASDPVRQAPRGVRIELRVIPRSPRAGFDGVRDGRLLVRVTAPPVERAANEAVVDAIARALDVPKRSVRLVAGQTSRNKAVEVEGLTLDAALHRTRLASRPQRTPPSAPDPASATEK